MIYVRPILNLERLSVKSTRFIVLALCAYAIAISLCVLPFADAQSPTNPQSDALLAPWYAADEILVSGSVESVVSKHALGLPSGQNLRISSTRGDLYANIGPDLGAKLSQKLTSGQFLTLTGMFRTYDGYQYFLVRTLNINGQIFVIRNALGIPMKNVSTATQAARIRQGSFGGSR
jgi:hypothetical protein